MNTDDKRKLVTEVLYVTETVADVLVYVDGAGVPYSTSTLERANVATTSSVLPSTTTETAVSTPNASVVTSSAPSSTFVAMPEPIPTPTSSVQPSPTPVTPSAEPIAASAKEASTTPMSTSTIAVASSMTPSSIHEPKPSPPPSSPPVGDPPVNAADSGTFPLGVTWDAYDGSSNCFSEAAVASQFSRMKEYKIIRIYGMDCNQISLAIQNALKNGQKLMGGAWMDPTGGGEDVSKVIQAYKNAIDMYAGGNWDVLQLFSVENERVNERKMTAGQVIDAISRARSQLRGLGYKGPVGAVETAPALIANPSICDAADIITANIHAFFDRNTKAQDAGTFVKSQVQLVKNACNNKRVVVTESGWPHQGNANGAAVPSSENQRAALASIRQNFSGDMFLFSGFDSAWKADTASTFNAERYWGIIN
ncbi:cell wall glucanase [Pyrenophora seminiperda CCB06]|uniref:Cell wall glucanase n=1 Tax=Pyrenophora seminiperda CCB06 TaxID=1302712 RepID=A0A3M7M6Q6_9PLEO|nr:cell wall glucanase [Pyrenophora seminiperda CCB06]